jgi:VWFA-related protein
MKATAMPVRCLEALAVLALWGACSCTLAAQSASPATTQPAEKQLAPFVFKTSSRLVVVDVVVTNSKGEPISDLQAEDFVIMEDGAPQPVRSFSFQQPAGERISEQNVAKKIAPDIVTNMPRHKSGAIWSVIVLDALNSPMLDQSDTRQQLLKVLEKLPDQPVAVYVLGTQLRLIQDFSSDPHVLRQAIASLNNKASMLLDNPKGGHEAERYPPAFFNVLSEQAKASIRGWEGESTAARTRSRLQITLDALNAIAFNLKPLPGRKNLIWVSEGFPFSIEPGSVVQARDSVSRHNYKVAVSQTANALFDAQIAIYPIDSRGIAGMRVYDASSRGFEPIPDPESQVGIGSTVSEQNNNLNATHTSMQEIAERTGGKAFYNRNEIGNAIVASMNDGGAYYTLGYYPGNHNWNGKFRRIGVKIKRPGARLRHRSGYFALEPAAFAHETQAEQARLLNQAMDINALLSTQLLFQARILSPSAQTQNQVVVNYLIDARGIAFTKEADDLQHASINCAVEVYSEKGDSIKKDGATLTAALKADVYEKVVRQGFPCQEKITLPSGDYLLRLGVRDNTTGMIGTADAKVSVLSGPPQKAQE